LNLALIPTLTLFDFEARKGATSDQAREAWIAGMVAELRAYSQAGGEILFGTDIGYIDHYDTAMEFTLMARAGMSFPQILASLTTAPRSASDTPDAALGLPWAWTPTWPCCSRTRPRT